MLQLYNINQISMSVQWPTNTRTSKKCSSVLLNKKDHVAEIIKSEILFKIPYHFSKLI